VRQYRFRVLVTLAPAGRGGPGLRLPNRMRALTAHACCLIQPARHREYFPAVICPDEELPPSAAHAMMTIALADGEAEAFFALGRCFTLWADGTVGRTVRAEGLVGYGVISGQISPLPAGAVRDRIHQGAGPTAHTAWRRVRRPPVRAWRYETPRDGTGSRARPILPEGL